MNRTKAIKTMAAGAAAFVGLGLVGGWAWARSTVDTLLERTWETHEVDFPVPFPLTADERGALPEAQDPSTVARERAEARGRHLVDAIYGCTACHGWDLSGGVMADEAAIMRVTGPNLTPAGRTARFSVADWDRAVRHGVMPDGTTSIMPVMDYARMSDRELSDIIAYARSLPPREDAVHRRREFGPVGTVLVASGGLVPDVANIEDHHAEHPSEPPAVAPTAAYGAHIAQVCTGCHRKGFEGGPLLFGPPDWPPATNLTPHEQGLAHYTWEDFDTVMTTGRRPDGSSVREPMAGVIASTSRQTEVERRALWAWLSSLPPTPTAR